VHDRGECVTGVWLARVEVSGIIVHSTISWRGGGKGGARLILYISLILCAIMFFFFFYINM
jgi:hypothetical protein